MHGVHVPEPYPVPQRCVALTGLSARSPAGALADPAWRGAGDAVQLLPPDGGVPEPAHAQHQPAALPQR